jgi:hypothetical protein
MPNTRVYNRAFSGGEMSPDMYGRIDDVKFQTGAAIMRNFIATPQGPAQNRSGLSFVRAVKDSTKQTRIIPFTFNTTQTMVIEVGAGYFRFHTQGATLVTGTPDTYKIGGVVTISVSSPSFTPTVITFNGHPYANLDRVVFTSTGSLPFGMVAGIPYYVRDVTTNTFRISLTPTGNRVATPSIGVGVQTVNTYSTAGTLTRSYGANYYAISDNYVTPPNATYWYPITSDAYEIPNSYAEEDLFDIHYVQSADVITFTHPKYPPAELKRFGALLWTFVNSVFTAPISAPTGLAGTAYTPTSAASNVDTFQRHYYVVTAVAADNISQSNASAEALGTSVLGTALTITGITKANPGVITTATHNLRIGDKVYITGIVGMTEINGFYFINSVPAASTFTLKTLEGVPVDTTSFTTWTSGGLVQSVFIPNNIYVSGAYNTLTWNSVSGAARYNIYKKQGGIYGYLGSSITPSFVDDNIAPDMGQTPPIYSNYFQSTDNYPGAVSYFEQRKCFAGTINDPQKIYMTRSGTENDMSYSIPIKDDDRIEFRVAAREANTIRHIVPLTQLILLTGSAEWRVSSVNSDAITPSSISVRPQSYIGASNVQPVIINNSLVYGAARGGHVRELGYSWQSSGFVTGDLSIRAAHLFDNLNIVDMTYSKAPLPIIWFVSSNGELLGLTYIPEQQIGAWHHHDTDGTFESVTCVAEGNEDVVYVVVKRLINGNYVRYIERMESRQITSIQNSFFVDSGATYNGTNTTAVTMTVSGGSTWGPADTLTITASSAKFSGTNDINDAIILTDSNGTQYRLLITAYTSSTVVSAKVDKTLPVALRNTATTVWNFARNSISGLTWLEGKTVSILADGAVHPQRVVTSGTVTLDVAANIVTVGLPYESDIETLPLAMQIDGFGQGRYKNINKAWLRVFKSSGIFIGPDANNLVEAKQRSTEPYGSPPALKSDEIMVMLTPSWASSGKVYVRQSDPLPLTIVGLTLEVAIGG